MFSLIICSRNKDISEELRKNISLTIGDHEYEIVVVDNSENKYNIFQAYNIGVEQAKYEYLCFMHEDILYSSEQWGNAVIKAFENPNIGMLGVAGGCYVGKYAFTWWDSGYSRGQYYDMVIDEDGIKHQYYRKWHKTFLDNDVVAIDGMWMCIRKEFFEKGVLSWDDKTYRGFHFYDMDMSMQVLHNGNKICIVEDLLIQHFSRGSFNKTFYLNCVRFHKKWNGFLPQSVSNFSMPKEYKESLKLAIIDLFRCKIKAIRNKWH